MATMRSYRRRFNPTWIGLWVIGVLCGALLMVGVNTVHRSSHPQPPVAVVSNSANTSAVTSVTNQVAGMRDITAGEANIASDTASQADIVGGRLGGLQSSDTANRR